MSKKYLVGPNKSYTSKKGIIHPGAVITADMLTVENAEDYLKNELKNGYVEEAKRSNKKEGSKPEVKQEPKQEEKKEAKSNIFGVEKK